MGRWIFQCLQYSELGLYKVEWPSGEVGLQKVLGSRVLSLEIRS